MVISLFHRLPFAWQIQRRDESIQFIVELMGILEMLGMVVQSLEGSSVRSGHVYLIIAIPLPTLKFIMSLLRTFEVSDMVVQHFGSLIVNHDDN